MNRSLLSHVSRSRGAFKRLCALAVAVALTALAPGALAAPRVRLTGPPKERAQFVGKAFTIGVSASGYDKGWVEVTSEAGTEVLLFTRSGSSYLAYTPTVAGEHIVTAVVTRKGSAQKKTSSVTLMVYPTDANERADWMARVARSRVGRNDAAVYVEGSSLSEEDDWCAVFVSWCARQLQMPTDTGLYAVYAGIDIYPSRREIACEACASTHQARFAVTPVETPEWGDLVFFLWGDEKEWQRKRHPGYEDEWHGNASHVGIVTDVAADGFTFVHGNTRVGKVVHGVAKNESSDERDGKRYRDWVVAFGRPRYGAPIE